MNDLVSRAQATTRHQRRIPVRPGSWWRLTAGDWLQIGHGDKAVPVPADTILLCDDVDFVDGDPHSVHLVLPPGLQADEDIQRRSPRGWSLLVAELVEKAKPVEEEVALAARQGEIDALNGAIQEETTAINGTQKTVAEIATGPTPAGLLDADATASSAESRQRQVQANQTLLTTRAARIAQASTEIAERATRIQTISARIAVYYQERALAAQASIKPVQDFVSRLGEKIDTISLYLGTTIGLTKIVDGAGAPADARLKIFQSMLYMDEELLTHLLDGGANIDDIDDFHKRLAEDGSLRDRIFGGVRGVVLMRARRYQKKWPDIHGFDLRQIYRLMEAEELDEKVFLMIRDGERIWRLDLPDYMQDIEKLFPTPDDLEAPYRKSRWWRDDPAQRIGQDSIEYAKAVETFRQLALQYERLLLILWGLHDRLQLFGPLGVNDPRNFADPGFQNDHIDMVMDGQDLLGGNRPAFHEFAAAKNGKVQPGSRIIAIWRHLVNHDSAPKWVEFDSKTYREIYNIRFPDPVSIATVKTVGGKLVVDAPVTREVWREGDCSTRHMNIQVPLHQTDRYRVNTTAPPYLVLDDVDPRDLDHYINSRTARKDYLAYMALFTQARNVLRAEEREDAPAIRALIDLGLPEAAARAGARSWRAGHKGRPAPAPQDKDFAALTTIARDLVAGPADPDLARAAADAMQAQGRRPLRLVRDGRGDLIGYAQPASAETAEMIDVLGSWPYVVRQKLRTDRQGRMTASDGAELPVATAAAPGETLLAEFAPWPTMPGFNLTAAVMRRRIKAILEVAETRSRILEQVLFDHDVEDRDWCAMALTMLADKADRSKQVPNMALVVPVGVVVSNKDGKARARIVVHRQNMLDWFASREKTRPAAIQTIEMLYRYADRRIERLPAIGGPVREQLDIVPIAKLGNDFFEQVEGDGVGILDPEDELFSVRSLNIDECLDHWSAADDAKPLFENYEHVWFNRPVVQRIVQRLRPDAPAPDMAMEQ